MSIFYENYISLCAKANKSPSGVAAAIGLSNAAATGWKNGKQPSNLTLVKLADFFGVSVDDLLSENENKPAPQMGSELDIKELVNSMTREQLLDFIVEAKIRLLDTD